MAKPILTKRYNADDSLSILCRGRVIEKFPLGCHKFADAFAEGWFGDEPVRWGKTQFRRGKRD